MEEVLKDKPFYANSGGGITVSGGECLSQSEFVYRILERSKIEGLHTALDTSGFAPWSELERVLPLVDLLLFDLKHLDSSRHKNATGVGNETIIYNLKAASALTRTWLRVPLIAGFNDGTDHIQQVARIGKAFGVEKLSFLPYHEGGKAKSIQLGFRDNLADFQAPSDARLLELKELGENEGVPVTIGK
jgi:pyruvate formate lyase activating enzyme